MIFINKVTKLACFKSALHVKCANFSTTILCKRSQASTKFVKKPSPSQAELRRTLLKAPLELKGQNKKLGHENRSRSPRIDIKEMLNHNHVFDYFHVYISVISQNRSDGYTRINDFLKKVKKDTNLLTELELVRVEQGHTIMYNRLLRYYLSYLQDLPCEKFSYKQSMFLQQLNHTKNQFIFTNPQDWFIPARRMKRKLIVHVGPTNSGKTYRALERLKSSQSGIYCGPLRLLALEVWKKFSDQGIRCNLVTGEERKLIEDGKPVPVTSCTVEMADFNTPIDVAVIDEIQMLSDHQRGFAWTRALLGIPAKEIHLCGEPRAVPIIKWIGEKLCEEVEVNTYDRLSPLSIAENPKPGVEGIKAGDCVVAFSRKNIFAFKNLIEAQTKFKCAVVYGNLPPENRAIQASLFNDKSSGYDVLVASDAVGMGLNLNIQRMVFSKMTKFNGASIQRLSTSMVKQIAGRAGRYGTQYANGIATTFIDSDFNILQEEMEKTIPDLTTAWIQPDASLIERATYLFPTLKLDQVLIMLGALAVTGPKFSFEFDYNQLQIARMLNPLKLPVDLTMTLLFAPFKVRDEDEKEICYQFAKDHSTKQLCKLTDYFEASTFDKAPQSKDLDNLEAQHRMISLYIWLSFRFPFVYPDYDLALEYRDKIQNYLQEALSNYNEKE